MPQPRGAEERGDWGLSEVRKQSSKCEQLEKDQTQQQELLEIVHKQLVLIPELKSEIEKQQKPEAETSERPQLSSDEMETEDDRFESRKAENRRIMDL